MEESGVLGFGAIAAPVLPRGVAATASSLPFMLQNYSSMNETEGSAVKESRESRLLVGDPVRVLSSFALDGRQFGLSTRIRNYGDVSGNRLLTRAALIGAATVRERLPLNTTAYLRNGVLSRFGETQLKRVRGAGWNPAAGWQPALQRR